MIYIFTIVRETFLPQNGFIQHPPNFFFLVKTEVLTQLFPIDLKSSGCLKKQNMGKTKKNEPDLEWWIPQASTLGGKILKKNLVSRPQLWKGSNNTLKKILQIWSTGLPRWQLPVEVAASWRCRLTLKYPTPYYKSQFCVTFPFVLTRKPADVYKHV